MLNVVMLSVLGPIKKKYIDEENKKRDASPCVGEN
jgi:hypothetical protein